MRLLYASHKIFKKITQIYGLFLNRESFFGKKIFCGKRRQFAIKKLYFRFFYY